MKKTLTRKQLIRSALLAIATTTAAQASAVSFTQIDLSSYVDSDLTTWSGGSNYPQNGGPISIGGINFNLATLPNNDTGVINSGGNASSTNITTNTAGATSAYAIINSAWGSNGAVSGALTFYGANPSDVFTYTLTEGTNIRDHYCCGGFVENVTASNLIGTANFGGGVDRLDAYQIQLPSSFSSDTLTSIVFTDNGIGTQGSPFLAAMTVEGGSSVVPLPAALPLFSSALVGLGFVLRRKRVLVPVET